MDHVELLLDGTVPAGASGVWEVGPGERTITMGLNDPADPKLVTAADSRDTPSWLPVMLSTGREATGPLLVNLEQMGSVSIGGPMEGGTEVLQAWALELATSEWNSRLELMLVEVAAPLVSLDRVRMHSTMAPVLDQLHRRRLAGREFLRTSGFETFAQARSAGIRECHPLVVIAGPGLPEVDRRDLVAFGPDPLTSTSVVTSGEDIGAACTLMAIPERSSVLVEPFGREVTPQRVTSDELAAVGALMAVAQERRSISLSHAPYSSLPVSGASKAAPVPVNPSTAIGESGARPDVTAERRRVGVEPSPGPSAAEDTLAIDTSDRSVDVMVSVLGPVEIQGAARPFTRAWARELVVYLAMHPDGAANDTWATALWPDRLMASSSLHSTASVARRSLGHDRNGRDLLPRGHGRLALSDAVGTDWARFLRLAGTQRVQDLKEALQLVRGRPFDGLRASDWPILEGITPVIEASVVDAAGRLAGFCLREGDPGGAEWAARRGLVVSPYDERLYRMLLRAADRAGNPAGVESVMGELLRLVADDVEPFDSVHPTTMELYRSLTRRRHLAAAPR